MLQAKSMRWCGNPGRVAERDRTSERGIVPAGAAVARAGPGGSARRERAPRTRLAPATRRHHYRRSAATTTTTTTREPMADWRPLPFRFRALFRERTATGGGITESETSSLVYSQIHASPRACACMRIQQLLLEGSAHPGVAYGARRSTLAQTALPALVWCRDVSFVLEL